MNIYLGIIVACWAAFIVYWAYSAPSAKRTMRRPYLGATIYWRLGIVIAAVILIKLRPPGDYSYLVIPPYTFSPWWGVLGCACAVVGVSFAVWARRTLGRNWGMPMSVKEKPELVVSGPYAYVRHPIYSGILLLMLGSTAAVGLWWLLVLFSSAFYFVFSAKKEEALMQKEFPNEYPEYEARTKALVPFLY